MDDPWHGLSPRKPDDPDSFLVPTPAAPTDSRTIAAFAEAFSRARWNEAAGMERLFGDDLPDWFVR